MVVLFWIIVSSRQRHEYKIKLLNKKHRSNPVFLFIDVCSPPSNKAGASPQKGFLVPAQSDRFLSPVF